MSLKALVGKSATKIKACVLKFENSICNKEMIKSSERTLNFQFLQGQGISKQML